MKRENVEHDLDSLIHMNGEWVTVKREVEIDMLKGVIALLDKNQELKDQVDILEDRKSLWEAKWELQSAACASGS